MDKKDCIWLTSDELIFKKDYIWLTSDELIFLARIYKQVKKPVRFFNWVLPFEDVNIIVSILVRASNEIEGDWRQHEQAKEMLLGLMEKLTGTTTLLNK